MNGSNCQPELRDMSESLKRAIYETQISFWSKSRVTKGVSQNNSGISESHGLSIGVIRR